MGNIIVAPPNQAAIISGPRGSRLYVGKTAFQFWCIERTETLSLELMTIPIDSHEAETTKGVRVIVKSIAQVKVRATKVIDNSVGIDQLGIRAAAQHFLGSSTSDIHEAVRRTLEGHQRQILGTLTVEEIYKDRAAFSEKVREHTDADLNAMGFELVSYTVVSIDDTGGYMMSLGATQTALVKREAREGKARNEAEAQKKVATYEAEAAIVSAEAAREAHVATNQQREQEAEADRDLELKRAEYQREVNTAQAEALAATAIERAKQEQSVVKETMEQTNVQAKVAIEIADKEVERQKRVKDGESMAELMAQKNEAEAIRVLADATSDKIKAIGDAEASAILAKGQAEAEVLEKKADAYKRYGEAAMVELVVEKLPAIAHAMADPLKQTEKMVFVSSDASAGSQLTGDVSRMVSQLPETVRSLTGFDMTAAFKHVAGQGGVVEAQKKKKKKSKANGLALAGGQNGVVVGGLNGHAAFDPFEGAADTVSM